MTTPSRPTYSFASDNMAGVSPPILAALAACNAGAARSYGADDVSRRLQARFAELFEHDVEVLLVSTGTAANALCIAAVTPPWGAVLCHPASHVNTDECGAPEFFSGAKLLSLDGPGGKIDPAALRLRAVDGVGDVHTVQPACVSMTQATEFGHVYTPTEIAELSAICRDAGLALHMDGARFANAIAALGCTPAELTWKAGVDVLSFGATKNGAMGVEAVVLFEPGRARELAFRRKRAGHLTSKMRFLAAQMEAYLADELWLDNARHANAMAARLARGLTHLPGVRLRHAGGANMLFCELPPEAILGLLDTGHYFYTSRDEPNLARLVTSFATTESEVDDFLAALRARI